MASLGLMFPLLIASAFSFEASSLPVQNALVTTFLVLYTFAYSWGGGVVPFLYSSEVGTFPKPSVVVVHISKFNADLLSLTDFPASPTR